MKETQKDRQQRRNNSANPGQKDPAFTGGSRWALSKNQTRILFIETFGGTVPENSVIWATESAYQTIDY
jgi:hypothetical protein